MKKTLLVALLVVAGSVGANQLGQVTKDFGSVRSAYDPKHTPRIEAPETVKAGEWFEVTISVGAEAVHPSLAEHHVHWIALYKNDVELARAYLNSVQAKPKVTFTIALEKSATLKAMEEPNHTAPWVATKKIKVVK